jgi:hypothetical protein
MRATEPLRCAGGRRSDIFITALLLVCVLHVHADDTPSPKPLLRVHAHNDYAHKHPFS